MVIFCLHTPRRVLSPASIAPAASPGRRRSSACRRLRAWPSCPSAPTARRSPCGSSAARTTSTAAATRRGRPTGSPRKWWGEVNRNTRRDVFFFFSFFFRGFYIVSYIYWYTIRYTLYTPFMYIFM